jgi:hypothetical protein
LLTTFFYFERWTKSEDDKLRKLKKKENMKWIDIEKQLPGRTFESCKKRWAEHINTEHVSFVLFVLDFDQYFT